VGPNRREVVVGVTKNAAIDPTGEFGGGRLVTICFDVVAAGQADLEFTGNTAGYDPNGTGMTNIVIPDWAFVGGTLTTR
jgi:hypothetical protein